MSFSISYSFLANDRFSQVANKIGNSSTQLSQKMKNLSKSVSNVGKKMGDVGKGLSLKLTAPILLYSGLSLKAFDKQAKAVAQVEAGLKATGGLAGRTLQQLKDQASSLQNDTLFGDEEILSGATAQLLTFTNIAGKQFDRTQKVILDVATRLAAAKGGTADLTGTSIMLGKALNDPVKNLSALGRSGIQFTEKQKKVITALAKGGQMAKAQSIILKELETQYGGSAKAAANAGTGGLKQLSNSIGDLNEMFGEILYSILTPLVGKMKSLVAVAQEWVKNNPKLARIAVIIGLVAAAVGPLLIALGFVASGFSALISIGSVLATIFSALSVAAGVVAGVIGAISLPVWLVIGGIIALGAAIYALYKNWDVVVKFMSGVLDSTMKMIGSTIDYLVGKWEGLVNLIKDNPLVNFAKDSIGKAKDFFGGVFGDNENTQVINNNKTDNPLEKQQAIRNTFDGNLSIDIADKGKNVQSATMSKKGSLNVGMSGVGL